MIRTIYRILTTEPCSERARKRGSAIAYTALALVLTSPAWLQFAADPERFTAEVVEAFVEGFAGKAQAQSRPMWGPPDVTHLFNFTPRQPAYQPQPRQTETRVRPTYDGQGVTIEQDGYRTLTCRPAYNGVGYNCN